jgi:hypothetical protein
MRHQQSLDEKLNVLARTLGWDLPFAFGGAMLWCGFYATGLWAEVFWLFPVLVIACVSYSLTMLAVLRSPAPVRALLVGLSPGLALALAWNSATANDALARSAIFTTAALLLMPIALWLLVRLALQVKSNYAFKPTAGEVFRSNRPLLAGGGLTRR